MQYLKEKTTKQMLLISTSIVIGVFLIQGFYLINYGLNFPFYDDFRYYASPLFALPDSLNLSWLTQAVNDTLSVVGFLLDYIILKLTQGNFFIISLFSYFIILGFILLFLAKIISGIVEDIFVRSLCFLLMLFMLTTGSYWGYQSIAYHQILPVFFGLLLFLFFQKKALTCSILLILAVSIPLTVATSLSYISGPFVIFSFSGIIFLHALFNKKLLDNSKFYGKTILIALIIFLIGLSAFIFQIYKIKIAQGSLSQVHTGDSLATPLESRFWIFLFGLYGRALGYTSKFQYNYVVDILIFLFINIPVVSLAILSLTKKDYDIDFFWKSTVILSISTTVFLYAGIASAGRVGLLHTENWNIISTLSKARFHYWWLSLMPAISLCACYLAINKISEPISDIHKCLLLTGLFIVMIFPKMDIKGYFGLWYYKGFYEGSYVRRAKGVSCLAENLSKNSAEIICPDFHPGNIAERLLFARSKNALFMQIMPPIIPNFTAMPTQSKPSKIGGACAIDTINNVVTRSTVISKAAGRLSVTGWAVNIESSAVPEMVIMRLTGINNDKIFYANTSGPVVLRPDVAKALNNPAFENSGFNITAGLDEVPPGSYTLELLQPTANNLLVCPDKGLVEIK